MRPLSVELQKDTHSQLQGASLCWLQVGRSGEVTMLGPSESLDLTMLRGKPSKYFFVLTHIFISIGEVSVCFV